jgi:hypothetical protein
MVAAGSRTPVEFPMAMGAHGLPECHRAHCVAVSECEKGPRARIATVSRSDVESHIPTLEVSHGSEYSRPSPDGVDRFGACRAGARPIAWPAPAGAWADRGFGGKDCSRAVLKNAAEPPQSCPPSIMRGNHVVGEWNRRSGWTWARSGGGIRRRGAGHDGRHDERVRNCRICDRLPDV